MKALSIAATGMQAQEMNVAVISNNIANLSTTGFKRQRAEFQDLLYQSQTRVGTTSSDSGTVIPTGVQVGLGVQAGAVYRISEQGNLVQTSNNFDIAISGKGFFQIDRPTGDPAYTRAGSFQINQDGDLVTSEGFPIAPGITIPQDAIDVDINENGEVLVTIDGSVTPSNVGQIELVNFINEAGLEAIGNNMLVETEASGTPISGLPGEPGFGTVLQSFLELSNVDAVTEITNLIAAQRAYELNSRIISTSDEMMQAVSQLR